MTSYVDTILIDCNRKGSEEYKVKTGVDEPAIFTCKQGAGIKLNPGDEVSIHSAYVNERGNEDNMEFGGKPDKDGGTYELEYTDLIFSRLVSDNPDPTETQMRIRDANWDGPDMRIDRGRADCMYYQYEGKGVGQSTAINKKKVFEVVDNEVNFSISYYKNMNGEGYLSLPRRFDAPNPTRPEAGTYGYGGSQAHNMILKTHGIGPDRPLQKGAQIFTGPGYPKPGTTPVAGTNELPLDDDYWYNLYTAYDGNARIGRVGDWISTTGDVQATEFGGDMDGAEAILTATRYGKGRLIYVQDVGTKENSALTTGQGVGGDCFNTGRCRPLTAIARLCKDDYRYESGFRFDDASTMYPGASNSLNEKQMRFGEDGQGYKHKQDNGRMTIYIQQTTFWDKTANNTTHSRVPILTGNESTATEIEAKNAVNDIFNGGQGPKDPALTTEWIRYREIKNVKLDTGYNTPDDVAEQFTDQLNKTNVNDIVKAEVKPHSTPQDISVKQTSECYKPFHSATHYTFGENAQLITDKYAGSNTAVNDQVLIDWQTAYHHIGVKRPDLWDAGRAIYYDQIMYPGTGTGLASARTFPTIKSTYTITKAGAQGVNGATIPTSIPWTKANVLKYKALFDAQATYPELFDYDNNEVSGTFTEYSVENARFLHIDLSYRDGVSLGSDNYDIPTFSTGTWSSQGNNSSFPIFFDYDPTRADIEYSDDSPVGVQGPYGIFVRIQTGTSFTIGFNAKVNKLGDQLFPSSVSITETSCIGWDCHFSAYGTKCIMLHTGNLNALYDGKTLQMVEDNDSNPLLKRMRNIYPHIRDTYLGANQLEVGVEEKGKFYIHQLHTPEYIGNSFSSGSTPDNPINPDASDQVYRVNKRLSGDNFCPDMVPYRPTIATETDAANDGKVEISNFNVNLSPYEVYDSMTGIFIEDTGIPLESWSKSLWGKLGFSYNQFNSANTGTRQTRLNNLINVNNIGAITTNADITAGDVPTYPRNAYGGEYYNTSLPNINYPLFESNSTEYGNLVIPSVPAITETQTSVKIMADGLPIKMDNPYLLVKSDIVSDTKYYGMGADANNNYTTGQCLPIVGVVNKENGFGDYYFQTITQMAFTITKPTIVSSITTSIHNPDMSYARLESDSAVIYKVKKNNTGNYNIASELIQKGKLQI